VLHCWHRRDHADPYGKTLLIIADAINGVIDKRDKKLNHWTAKKQSWEGIWSYEQFPKEFGIFIDWCSLHQRAPKTNERTPDEQEAFNAALGDLELWFAHQVRPHGCIVWYLTDALSIRASARAQLTTVLLLTNSAPSTRPAYYDSGWPTYECNVARILKKRRSDLWDPIYDVGDPTTLRHRQPPICIERFRELMRDVIFANKADAATVFRLYARTLHATLSGANSLHFEDCEWEALEMGLLIRVLPDCTRLTTLKLSDNLLRHEALDLFAGSVGMHRALPELRLLDLRGNSLIGLTNPLQSLAEAVSPVSDGEVGLRPPGLPLLQELNLKKCNISVIAFVNFCRALKRGALPTLLRLSLDDNPLEEAAVDPLTKAFDRGAMEKLQIVTGIPRSGSSARRDYVVSLRRLRMLGTRIETNADNAARQYGTAMSQVGMSAKVLRIEQQLVTANALLDRDRRRAAATHGRP